MLVPLLRPLLPSGLYVVRFSIILLHSACEPRASLGHGVHGVHGVRVCSHLSQHPCRLNRARSKHRMLCDV